MLEEEMQEGDWGWDAQESGCSGVRMLRSQDAEGSG